MAKLNAAANRADELAEHEDLSVLHSALYSAYEAELSSAGWPGNSQIVLNSAFEELESLGGYINAS